MSETQTSIEYMDCADGSRRWLRNWKLHRDGDLPAIERADGTREWYRDGKLHRDNDKPAAEYADGSRDWWVNGKLQREWIPGWEAIYHDGRSGYTLHRSPEGQYRVGPRWFEDATAAFAYWYDPDYPDPELADKYLTAIKTAEDFDNTRMADQIRKPMWIECGECGEKWIAVWLPIALPLIVNLLKGLRCPRCASGECFVLGVAPRGSANE